MHVESHARKHFFVIINGLVTYLKKATDENEIKAILNALKWKYSARDHTFLNKMQIFNVLHLGDGKKDNKLKRCWGRQIKSEVIADVEQTKLHQEVLEVFESIFLLTVGRIVKPDTGTLVKTKAKGTSVPNLERQVS